MNPNPSIATETQSPDGMVERVARAIFEDYAARSPSPNPHWDSMEPYARQVAIGNARAAIEAMREPTRAMLDCLYLDQFPADAERGKAEQRKSGDEIVPYSTECEVMFGQYQRMIDAALSSEALTPPNARL